MLTHKFLVTSTTLSLVSEVTYLYLEARNMGENLIEFTRCGILHSSIHLCCIDNFGAAAGEGMMGAGEKLLRKMD